MIVETALRVAIAVFQACPPSKWVTADGTGYCDTVVVKADGKGAEPDRVQFIVYYAGVDRPASIDAEVFSGSSMWYASAELVPEDAPFGDVVIVGYAWRGDEACEIAPPLVITRICK
jgi:hypothetical protein